MHRIVFHSYPKFSWNMWFSQPIFNFPTIERKGHDKYFAFSLIILEKKPKCNCKCQGVFGFRIKEAIESGGECRESELQMLSVWRLSRGPGMNKFLNLFKDTGSVDFYENISIFKCWQFFFFFKPGMCWHSIDQAEHICGHLTGKDPLAKSPEHGITS